MAALVMPSASPQSNTFHQNTIKCATCSKPLKFEELETHVCPTLSSPAPTPAPAPTPPPPRTPSPLAASRVALPKSPVESLRNAQTPTPQALSPLSIARPARSPSPASIRHISQTAPLSLKRSATENVNSSGAQRNLDTAARGSRPPEEMTLPGSPRRSMTAPMLHRGVSAPLARASPVESFISQSASFQIDHGGTRDNTIPTLSIHIADTETGGQAGRAGVGRRAFAAVAQAALLASSYGLHHQQSPSSPISPPYSQHFPYGIQPPYLDPTGRGTPSLSIPRSSPSPRIPEVRTPSPGISIDPRVASGPFHVGSGLHSHMSPSISAQLRSSLASDEHLVMPHNDKVALVHDSHRKSQSVSSPSRSSTLESETELGYRGTNSANSANEPPTPKQSPPRLGARRADTAPNTVGPSRQGTMEDAVADARLRMLQRSETAPLDPSRHVDDPKHSSEGTSPHPSSPTLNKRPRSPTSTASSTTTKDSVAFPSGSKSDEHGQRISTLSSSSSYTSPSLPDEENNRLSTLTTSTTRLSLASSSALSTLNPGTSSRRISKSTGSRPRGLKLPMETVEEEGPSTPTANKHFGADSSVTTLTIPPSRQRTNSGPSIVSIPQSRTRKRTVRTCVKCGAKIDDGRWIAVDVTAHAQSQQHLTIKSNSSSLSSSSSIGDVLCEKDWKEMYLPKCRRCGLTIENQAVSSADGQLKGKYHRTCFDCSTCHKSFPDKEFYVFAGQPYCEYHYHVSNNSLCASPSCGEPIEGPCAEDHEGRRYHPEHLSCQQSGCKTRLVEYFCDANGHKFCERHAKYAQPNESALASIIGDDHDDNRDLSSTPSLPSAVGDAPKSPSTRAEKRRTRFLQI